MFGGQTSDLFLWAFFPLVTFQLISARKRFQKWRGKKTQNQHFPSRKKKSYFLWTRHHSLKRKKGRGKEREPVHAAELELWRQHWDILKSTQHSNNAEQSTATSAASPGASQPYAQNASICDEEIGWILNCGGCFLNLLKSTGTRHTALSSTWKNWVHSTEGTEGKPGLSQHPLAWRDCLTSAERIKPRSEKFLRDAI